MRWSGPLRLKLALVLATLTLGAFPAAGQGPLGAVSLSGPSSAAQHGYVTFRGVVSLSPPAPAPHADVRLWLGTKQVAAARTAPDGTFAVSVHFPDLGLHALTATAFDGTPLEARSPVLQVRVVPALTARQAVARADVSAKRWAADAVLFAVVGAERSPSVPASTISGSPGLKPQPADRFPCGEMDDDVWRVIDPTWNGEADGNIGDGRIPIWQPVYFSLRKNQGMAVVVREGHPNTCIADPLTPTEQVELRRIGPRLAWMIDSNSAVAAIRRQPRVDRPLGKSASAQVSYGFDLRRAPAWGIKGSTKQPDVAFSASVDLTRTRVFDLRISP